MLERDYNSFLLIKRTSVDEQTRAVFLLLLDGLCNVARKKDVTTLFQTALFPPLGVVFS